MEAKDEEKSSWLDSEGKRGEGRAEGKEGDTGVPKLSVDVVGSPKTMFQERRNSNFRNSFSAISSPPAEGVLHFDASIKALRTADSNSSIVMAPRSQTEREAEEREKAEKRGIIGSITNSITATLDKFARHGGSAKTRAAILRTGQQSSSNRTEREEPEQAPRVLTARPIKETARRHSSVKISARTKGNMMRASFKQRRPSAGGSGVISIGSMHSHPTSTVNQATPRASE